MANITKEQVLQINGKCSNGFVLNLRYFAYHREKQLRKYISLEKNKLLENNKNIFIKCFLKKLLTFLYICPII